MQFFRRSFLPGIATILFLGAAAFAGDTSRDLSVAAGGSLEIINPAGRVLVKAESAKNGVDPASKLTISSPGAYSDEEIKVTAGNGSTLVEVRPRDAKQRIDLTVTLPERTSLRITTEAGGVEAMGNFASIWAKTDTGTVAVDVPTDALQYRFLWTESRPRYLADFDIEKVKEKSGGKFEIKGSYSDGGTTRKHASETRPVGSVPGSGNGFDAGEKDASAGDPKAQTPRGVALDLTTARGIILLNVSPNEVMSDLRERPLTNAAKAIVRSGDSLLMEAIRRASPKYFGDYARTLPPLKTEPTFAQAKSRLQVPVAAVKTATVRVTDLRNRAIDGLAGGDFEITENGESREIVSV
ncbi:MAG: hypothetical protein JO314_04715, partial [Acidobacteria bacterium]|nr:hypothetical protein [Acidobacteriota bacterium]